MFLTVRNKKEELINVEAMSVNFSENSGDEYVSTVSFVII